MPPRTDDRHPLRRKLDQLIEYIEYVRGPSAFSRRKPRFPGELRRIPQFRSQFLDAVRDVVVYLPPGYQYDVSRRFPVLYMHDGQNLFEPSTAFIKGQHWQVGETIGDMINAGAISPLIVVGIYNAGEKRIDEYTHTRDTEWERGGEAGRYGEMILQELKPRIDRDFRTLSDATSTALAGSSLGGLVSLYLGLNHPETFGKLGVLSPSVWWDERAILRNVKSFRGQRPRIWLDIGTAEGDEAVRNARHLAEALTEKGWQLGYDLNYVEVVGAGHHEQAWAARMGDVLRFLFAQETPAHSATAAASFS